MSDPNRNYELAKSSNRKQGKRTSGSCANGRQSLKTGTLHAMCKQLAIKKDEL